MLYSVFWKYVHNTLSHIPWEHWVIIIIVALALSVLYMLRRKDSVYGSIVLGMTVLVGLFLLDTAVVIRCLGLFPHGSGFSLSLDRLINPNVYSRTELIANTVVFIPFGFFLSEFLSSTRQTRFSLQICFVVLVGLGLSMCIEYLQLTLHAGFFEFTDLVTNTVGTFVGASLSFCGRIITKKRV